MLTKNQFAISIVWYSIGFAIARLLEYPIRLLLIYPLAYLFSLFGFVPDEIYRENIVEIAQVYWFEYIHFIRNSFYWTLWLGSGMLAGCAAVIINNNQWRIDPRVLKVFTASSLVLAIYGCIIGFHGLPYELPAMNFVALPLFIITQFYVGTLLARWLPRVYSFLGNTRIAI